MSDIGIYATIVKGIKPHPFADRLDVVEVFGTQTCAPKGRFIPREVVIYFPPDIMIPEKIATQLGVVNYLKHARYNGERQRCRVSAARIRGVPSYGFIEKAVGALPGDDLTARFQGLKYQPPTRMNRGQAASDIPKFPKYTDIQHYWKYSHIFEKGMKVMITEKIHGTNFRTGKINGEYYVGSHKTRRVKGYGGVYDVPLQNSKVQELLDSFDKDVIIYGEIFGEGVQDMDYGESVPTFAVFDIMVDGQYLPPCEAYKLCDDFGLPFVPVLYMGDFDPQLVKDLTEGGTHLQPSKNFDGREGIVIQPLEPFHCEVGRAILKSVSAAYYERKNKNEEMLFDPGEKYESPNQETDNNSEETDEETQ